MSLSNNKAYQEVKNALDDDFYALDKLIHYVRTGIAAAESIAPGGARRHRDYLGSWLTDAQRDLADLKEVRYALARRVADEGSTE